MHENLILFFLLLLLAIPQSLILFGRTISTSLFFRPSFFTRWRLEIYMFIRLGLKRWRLFSVSYFFLVILYFRFPVFMFEFLVPGIVAGSIIDIPLWILIFNHYVNCFLTVILWRFLNCLSPLKRILRSRWGTGQILLQTLMVFYYFLLLFCRVYLYCLDQNTINILIPKRVFLNLISFIQQYLVDL